MYSKWRRDACIILAINILYNPNPVDPVSGLSLIVCSSIIPLVQHSHSHLSIHLLPDEEYSYSRISA
jgi:hypothetical protein